MKARYWILMVILILVAAGFEILLFCSSVGQHPRLENGVQSAGIFVALLAALIALSAVDPKREKVNVKVEKVYITDKKEWDSNKLSDQLNRFYGNCRVIAYRVHFKIRNVGFELKKPIITFAVPAEKQPPSPKLDSSKKVAERAFTVGPSDTIDSPVFGVDDNLVLSRSGLPYWNNEQALEFWIRMLLDDTSAQFDVVVSVNCDDADGYTKTVTLNPKKLLEDLKSEETRSETGG